MSVGALSKNNAWPRLASSTEPPQRAEVARVRPMVEDDLEPVAKLFLQRFRKGAGGARGREEVAACMKALYLDYPARQGDADALVAVDPSGDIGAFSGAARARYLFDGRPASVCVTGALMASPEPVHALAAVQILRESRKLDYDLIVTDSANRASLAMCQAVGYQPVSPDSLEWACIFDPASLALHKIRQRLGQPWLGALKPFARVADLAASPALRAATGAPKKSEWRDEEVDDETFVDIAPRFLASFRLAPDFTREDFLWRIAMARQRRSAGPLHLQVVYDSAGAAAAAYAAYGAKGDVARILHAVAAPHAWGRLFDRMRETARARGCIGAHGSLKRQMMAHAYSVRGVFFYYAGGVMAYSNRADIRQAIESGEAFLGGFAGDRWTRLASDVFG
jgi:hypothetical protein